MSDIYKYREVVCDHQIPDDFKEIKFSTGTKLEISIKACN